MIVEYKRMYGVEFRINGLEGDKVNRIITLAGLLRRLRASWFARRDMNPIVTVSDDYSDVWLEWDEGERRIYIEVMLCVDDCGYDAEGILEVVGYSNSVFHSLLNAFLKEARNTSPYLPVRGVG